MLSIKVLGSGCAKCNRVEQRAAEALERVLDENPSVEASIEHVTEYDEIMKYPVMMTPALVINEQVVCSGCVPGVEEVTTWIETALGTTDQAAD